MNPNGLLWTVPCRPCLRCRSTGWRHMTERQIRDAWTRAWLEGR